MTPDEVLVQSRRIESAAANRGLVVERVEVTPSVPLWVVLFLGGRRLEAASVDAILQQLKGDRR